MVAYCSAEELGPVLAEFRRQAGLSQQKAANMVGVSVMLIRRVEWGVQMPHLSYLPRIARALGLRITIEPDMPETPFHLTGSAFLNNSNRTSSP